MIRIPSKRLVMTPLLAVLIVTLSECTSHTTSIDRLSLYEAPDDDLAAGMATVATIAPDAPSADARRLDTKGQTPKANPNWPPGYQLTIDLSLAQVSARNYRRPYVAVWIEGRDGKAVRYVSVWGRRPKYQSELRVFYPLTRFSGPAVDAVTRPTRPAGQYTLLWDGMDNAGKPLPAGEYTVHVEVAREHGTRQHMKTAIACKDSPTQAEITGNVEVSSVVVRFGPDNE
jgi:hypothetical protein